MRIISGLLFITLFVLAVIILDKQTGPETQPSFFLPPDTLVYAEQKNGVQALEQFRQSRLGKALASIELVEVLRDVDVDQQKLSMVEEALRTIDELRDNQLVHELMGRKLVVALFPSRPWSLPVTIEDGMKKQLLLISKPRYSAKLLDLITSYYSGNTEMTLVPYGGHTIKRFQLERDTLSVAVVDGYVLGSLEERILREGLDNYDRGKDSLASNTEFRQLIDKLPEANRVLYLSLDGVRDLTRNLLEASSVPEKQVILNELKSTNGFTAAGYGAWEGSAIVNDKLMVLMKDEEMSPFFQDLLSIPPEINETLGIVSDDMLIYYWSNTMNLGLLWEMYVNEVPEGQGGVEEFRELMLEMTGKQIEEIMGTIDGGISMLFQQSPRSRFIPVPDLSILIKLKDPEQVADILKKIFSKLEIDLQTEQYKDVTYQYWGLYRHENLQPVYAIYKNYLILANTLDGLKTIVNTPASQKTLVDSKDFAEIDPGFSKKNNSVCYIDQAALVSVLRELVSWGGTMLAIQDRQAAEKSKILIDRLINPLLHGLAMYEKTGTRSYILDDAIIIESTTRIIK